MENLIITILSMNFDQIQSFLLYGVITNFVIMILMSIFTSIKIGKLSSQEQLFLIKYFQFKNKYILENSTFKARFVDQLLRTFLPYYSIHRYSEYVANIFLVPKLKGVFHANNSLDSKFFFTKINYEKLNEEYQIFKKRI